MENLGSHSLSSNGAQMRGNAPAKIDAQGRIKIPTAHRKVLDQHYSDEFYITSWDGKKAQIYPMEEWLLVEAKVGQMPKALPQRQRFELITSYYGQAATLDKQGRLPIPAILRSSAEIDGEVVVIGRQNYLEVWNHEKCLAELISAPLSEEDMMVLAERGL